MRKRTRVTVVNFESYNRKSKIQNGKWAGIFAVILTCACGDGVAEAQQATKIPRIGYVSGTGNASNQGPYVEALRQGLRDLGYIEGKNFAIEYPGAEGKPGRRQALRSSSYNSRSMSSSSLLP
jgi:hypothetical protein